MNTFFTITFRFPNMLLYFYKSFPFPNQGILQTLQLWNKHYFVCKQYVGAGINTLMSNFDGLGPSIFCRKMERTRPMREVVDVKVVYLPPESAFRFRSVSFTDHPSELIRTNAKPLRKKRIFSELFIPKGAIFVITYSLYLIYIHLLSVISLAYCAKVLSN